MYLYPFCILSNYSCCFSPGILLWPMANMSRCGWHQDTPNSLLHLFYTEPTQDTMMIAHVLTGQQTLGIWSPFTTICITTQPLKTNVRSCSFQLDWDIKEATFDIFHVYDCKLTSRNFHLGNMFIIYGKHWELCRQLFVLLWLVQKLVLWITSLYYMYLCCRFFIVGSKDMTARIYSLNPMENFVPVTLSGHRNTVIGCLFVGSSLDVS